MYSTFLNIIHRVYVGVLYSVGIVAVVFPVLVNAAKPRPATRTSITLLQPISGGDTIALQPGLGTWFAYFGSAGQWLYNIAIGFCVLWILVGGIQVMTSSDASDRRAKGFDKMKASIFGVIILTFSGLILRTLNSMFYT